MATEKMSLRIATPECVKYDDDADMVIMRCVTGDMGILPNHEQCSAILDIGVLRILNGDEERRIAVFGGIAQVRENAVTVLANDAQWPEDIDVSLVEAEHEKIQRRIQESVDSIQIQKDQVLLRRTFLQLEVSSYPILAGNR